MKTHDGQILRVAFGSFLFRDVFHVVEKPKLVLMLTLSMGSIGTSLAFCYHVYRNDVAVDNWHLVLIAFVLDTLVNRFCKTGFANYDVVLHTLNKNEKFIDREGIKFAIKHMRTFIYKFIAGTFSSIFLFPTLILFLYYLYYSIENWNILVYVGFFFSFLGLLIL